MLVVIYVQYNKNKCVKKNTLILKKTIVFLQVNESEQNGITLKSVLEVENEDNNGYWFASICSTEGSSIQYSSIIFVII